jgi:CheY-like chemotaxis protein
VGNISTAYGRTIRDLDVLIVEDNATMRLLLRTLLHNFKVRDVRQARDGEDAIRQIAKQVPDVIISDWEMQPMNGRDFLLQLRRKDNFPICFVPVIILTAHASRALIQEAFDCGATHLLVKPVTPANLLHRIEWVLADEREFEEAGDIFRQPSPLLGPASKPVTLMPNAETGETEKVWNIDE